MAILVRGRHPGGRLAAAAGSQIALAAKVLRGWLAGRARPVFLASATVLAAVAAGIAAVGVADAGSPGSTGPPARTPGALASAPAGSAGPSTGPSVPPLPAAAAGLRAVPGAVGTARLCWEAAEGAAEYVLEYRDVTAGEAWTLMPYPIGDVCYTVEQLAVGRTYEFRIVGSNSAGNGAPSNVVRVAVTRPLPAAVTGLTAVPGAVGTARLCWEAAEGAAEYVLEYRDVTAGEAWTLMPYPIGDVCYTVEQLAVGRTYEFRIVGSNSAGNGAPSNVVRVTVTRPLPAAVTGLTAVPGSGTAELCWNAADGANRYLLEHRDVTAGEAWATMPYPIDGLCYTVRQLLGGHTYELRITGSNSAGNGPPSNTVTVTPTA
ncbi:fibronectin type III domain-containing protein [Frankia nepalensis]|uniref:fibronectin type III domain-containing protein n=2 Tax=Frankia nepalensis TaxID=1836974 RepID=UPI00193286AE|nr:fibronectin type III domain-containing protein [Frankia nepalensis]MBL7513220.1 hypothetical protein [Frankia nepalensis]